MDGLHDDHALYRLMASWPFFAHHDGGMDVQGEDKGKGNGKL